MQHKLENRFANDHSSVIEYSESDYLPYSDKKLFNLIADVERYPQFLPGWLSVNVLSRTDRTLTVRQKVGVPLVNWEFNSTADLDRPRHIHIYANDGPFRYLDIHWHLESITRETCRVMLTVKAEIDTETRSMIDAIVRQSVHSLLMHFSARAREIYSSWYSVSN